MQLVIKAGVIYDPKALIDSIRKTARQGAMQQSSIMLLVFNSRLLRRTQAPPQQVGI